jgi:hypothetical protein
MWGPETDPQSNPFNPRLSTYLAHPEAIVKDPGFCPISPLCRNSNLI